MQTQIMEKRPVRPSWFKKVLCLVLIFAVIIAFIFIFRSAQKKDSEFHDTVAGEISREMEDNQWVINPGRTHRTSAEFGDAVMEKHGKVTQLKVYTAHLSDSVSLSSEIIAGWKVTGTYQDITFEGDAQYTVDLSGLSRADFTVNNELNQVTVRIPYAVLEPINIPADKIKFHDVEKGWLAASEIKLTPEQNAQIMVEVGNRMKAMLIDEEVMALANESAKEAVAALLTTTVKAVDPAFSVTVVQ